MQFQRVCLFADTSPKAQEVKKTLSQDYTFCSFEEAQVGIVIGGDGFMLRTLHSLLKENKIIPLYGINAGHIGFLMNSLKEGESFIEKLSKAVPIKLPPLSMTAYKESGEIEKIYAVNEVALMRVTPQTSKVRITVDGIVRLQELLGDGILLATPAGSTAYNYSAHGPILPLGANVLALTPINAFRPRRWRGALLPREAKVCFEVLDPSKRPVNVTADFYEVSHVLKVEVEEDSSQNLLLLFDPEHNLEHRILNEQFLG